MKQHAWLLLWLLTWSLGAAQAAPPLRPTGAPPADETLRPFDARDFALAYDVLLGAGDLQRAFLVAQQAVAALPLDPAWRRKLAQVSEWTQRPQVAAEQWIALFRQGDRSADVVQAVIRLAPMVDQPMLALQAWQVQANRQALTDNQWRDVYSLYETAAEPAQGSLYFETRFAQYKNPLLLEFAGRLAENAGDDDRAQRLYLQRADLAPFSLDVVLRAVVHLVRRDKMQQALAVLEAHEQQVPAASFEYWRLLSQVAWEARAFDKAQAAYARYAELPQATAADWSRLIFLVREQHPEQAADLALQAWRRFGSATQLLLGLSLYAEHNNLSAQARAYAALADQAEVLAVQEPRFLLLRAQFYQRQKKPDLAWVDLHRALQLHPVNNDVVLAGLWFLIDNQKTKLLPAVMQRHAAQAQLDPAFWQAYAAASLVLAQHREAVIWYAKAARQQPDNELLLLNYADALALTRQTGMADRVRRHAWLLLKNKHPQPVMTTASLAQNPDLLALARLSLLDQPGDHGLALVRQWVSQLRGLPDAPGAEQTTVLVLGWAVLKEQFGNARQWMWQRYARQSQQAAPLWGQSQTALQLSESQTLQTLLDQHGSALPVENHIDMAVELGHTQQALDLAFNAMAQQDSETLYDRFRQHAPAQANYVQLGVDLEQQGSQDSRGMQLEARLNPHAKLQLVLTGVVQHYTSHDAVLAELTPASGGLQSLQVQWLGPRGPTRLALARRQDWDGLTSLQLTQNLHWGSRVQLEVGMDWRVGSTLSQAARQAAYENSLWGSANYALGKREYVRVAPRLVNYYTRFGDALGSSQLLDLELGYRLRTEYPDWRLRGVVSHQNFSRTDGLRAATLALPSAALQSAVSTGSINTDTLFIPDDSTSLGLCASLGDAMDGQGRQNVYLRAWRPFLDVCFNHNPLTGSGFNSVLGVAGSLLGNDRLLLQLKHSDGTQPGSTPSKTLALRYRHYF